MSAQPCLLEPVLDRSPLPAAVLVLRDWCIERFGWAPAVAVDPLSLCLDAEKAGAPRDLVGLAYDATWEDWRKRTEPTHLLVELAKVRGPRKHTGKLSVEWLRLGCEDHHAALVLAISLGVHMLDVRTHIRPPHSHGRQSDEVRLQGTALTLHRRKSPGGSCSSMRWKERWEPDGWRRESKELIKRACRWKVEQQPLRAEERTAP